MVDKPSRSYLDNIGIDSYERAIVFSWAMLRAEYLSSPETNLRDIFQLGFNIATSRDDLTQQITLRFALFYGELQTLTRGLNILEAIIPKQSSSYVPDFPVSPPSMVKIAPMDDGGDNLPNLESYLLYACQRVLSVNVQERFRAIAILPVVRGNSEEGRLDGLVRLDFDYQYYLMTNDLVGSIGGQLSPDTSGTPPNPLSNSNQLNNDSQLTNGEGIDSNTDITNLFLSNENQLDNDSQLVNGV
ncbi:hypothetical protein AA637_11810 [Cyanobacterium sp. HL-69]|uniref:hypothetical protein n=1 Tax=Cyanobacterium sp. HL-69 TaxID=2054282 RepID=UPI000CA23674|nr:hypothetical protein AA637_11810 [Cyanobacterium sp. HL-69]